MLAKTIRVHPVPTANASQTTFSVEPVEPVEPVGPVGPVEPESGSDEPESGSDEPGVEMAAPLRGWALFLEANRLKLNIFIKALVMSSLALAALAPVAFERGPLDLLAEALKVNKFLVYFSAANSVYFPLFLALDSTATKAGQDPCDWTTKKKRWTMYSLVAPLGLAGSALVAVAAPGLTAIDADPQLAGKCAIMGLIWVSTCLGYTLSVLWVKTREKSWPHHVLSCTVGASVSVVGYFILFFYIIATVELANADLSAVARVVLFGFVVSIVKGLVLAACERVGNFSATDSFHDNKAARDQVVMMWVAGAEVCCNLGSLYGMFQVRPRVRCAPPCARFHPSHFFLPH